MRLTAPDRWTDEWITWVKETGRWDEPAHWRAATYLKDWCWSPAEVEGGFAAALRVYPHDVARNVFVFGTRLCQLLADPLTAPYSELLSLGWDALDAGAWQYSQLIKKLRTEAEYESARFELAILSALKRATLPTEYEPLRNLGGRNPDFEVMLGGEPLLLDAKLPRSSDYVREEREWLEHLVMARLDPLEEDVSVPREIYLTHQFAELQDSSTGRAWLRSNERNIVERMRGLVERLGRSVSFPVTGELADGHGRILAIVKVLGPSQQSGSYGAKGIGIPFDERREAKRLRHTIESGGAQFPAGRFGAVVMDIGRFTSLNEMKLEVMRWFGEEGTNYPETIGVILVGGDLIVMGQVFNAAVPIWRPGAPRQFTESAIWKEFSRALSIRYVRPAPGSNGHHA